MQMPDEELVEWYRWQNKGAINRAAGGFTSTYGLTMPYMDEDGYIRFNMNPQGDEKPLFDLFDYWGNDLNPVYTTKHNEGVTKQIEDDPYGVRPYQKEYGDDWFDPWYEKNQDIDPEDLDDVLNKYDIPTFGNAMPGFGDGMMGALSAFFPGGKGFMGGDMTPLTTQLASLNAKLDTVINQQAQGKTIVLNTGALVGNIGGAMDKFLGNTVLNKTRTGGVNV